MKKVTSAAKLKYSISISYPPLDSPKGIPFLSQNRQFQWTNTHNVILPVIPAYAATALKQLGYTVFWDDAIAENISYSIWFSRLLKRHPSVIVFETKTPVIKRHWQIINNVKAKLPNSIIVLMGDHVTALPEESLSNSSVDYILTGGDYDFMLLNLVDHLTSGSKLEPGFYYHKNNKLLNTGKFALKHHDLDKLPIIDRELTKWKLYAYNNTNFKNRPGAYIMSGRDCWWGKCTFCSWTTTYPSGSFRTFSVDHTIKEITNLVNNYGVKEIFDDSGTLPIGQWLNDLCLRLIDSGLNKKVILGCNMRFSALNQKQYHLMKKAGFRFILYGLESSNQKTLNRICKNTKTSDARETLTLAKNAGLEPHVTIMIGYPWESEKDIQKTLCEARTFFRDGLVDSMQATIVVPYPGTPLFKECLTNNWLLTKNWNDFDMQQPVMKTSISAHRQKQYINNLFKAAWEPRFLIRKVLSIRSLNDIRHLFTYAIKYLQKLKDFSTNGN